MFFLDIPMDELFKVEKISHDNYLKEAVQNKISKNLGEDQEHLPYFPFNSNWIEKQKFNWQNNIQIVANRRFEQFILLNMSSDPLEDKNKSIYIHGEKFKHLLLVENIQNSVLEVPFLK